MIKKVVTLFKIARTLALSDALDVIYKIHQPPLSLKIFFKLFSIKFSKKNNETSNLSDEEKLCNSIQNMGTSFIKLGQFLSYPQDLTLLVRNCQISWKNYKIEFLHFLYQKLKKY